MARLRSIRCDEALGCRRTVKVPISGCKALKRGRFSFPPERSTTLVVGGRESTLGADSPMGRRFSEEGAIYMGKIVGYMGMFVGGWIGWAAGAWISVFAAFLTSMIGTGLGLYAARRLAMEFLP